MASSLLLNAANTFSVSSSSRRASRRLSVVVPRASSGSSSSNPLLGAAGFAAGVLLLQGTPALALDLSPGQQYYSTQLSLDQARDTDEDQRKRFAFVDVDGLTADETKARLKSAYNRLQSSVRLAVDKNYWTDIQNEIRGPLGTLRYDIDQLAASKGKKDTRSVELRNNVVNTLNELDLTARSKDATNIQKQYAAAVNALSSAVSYFG